MKGSFPTPTSLIGASFWFLLNLYNSVICCQCIFAKETKICLLFPLLQPVRNLGCVQRDVDVCINVYWGVCVEINFQVIYFPIESLPCSQGRTVFPMCKFG